MQFRYIFLVFIFLKGCNGKRYDKYTLFRGMPVTEDDILFFKNLSEAYDVNFWKSPGLVNMPVEFTISPNDTEAFVKEASSKNIYLTTIIKDIQRAFDNQTVKTYIRRNMASFDWRSYFGLQDIYNWLKDLKRKYPKEIRIFSIGKTIEKRKIIGVKLVLKGCKRRSKVIVEGGIHAREWISPAFVTYFLNELLHAKTSKNKQLQTIALAHEWYFIPVLNPDGYEYTHKKDRLWRKNRRGGYGVDINRNFDASFGSVGVSRNRDSESYCGTKPFSEAESAAMRRFVRKNRKNLEYYIAFHSYGQLFILPYAYSKSHYENFNEVKVIGEAAAHKIKGRYGTVYEVGTAYDTLGYMAAGVSGCWVKKTYKVPVVATIELRDTGETGFALPPDQILPTCLETMDGMIEIFNQQRNPPKMLSANGFKDELNSSAFVLNVLLLMMLGLEWFVE